jgi:UDP-N-acetylglucosamine 2-epimerase (non-hydrolysing)
VAVYHVEAGLRSFDRNMPEEINRLVTDAVSDVLFVSEPSGMRNLKAEGIADGKIHFVGNVMIDTLKSHLARAEASPILAQLGVEPRAYVAVTLHRPSNVDDARTLGGILDAFENMLADGPVIFPIHPRTRKNLSSLGLQSRIDAMKGLRLIEPLGYLDFLKLTASASVVVTDSGGVQEETTILGVPCLTVRENTERPATVVSGTNRIVGTNPAKIVAGYRDARGQRPDDPPVPEKWDGRAAERIVSILGGMSRAGRVR